MFRPKKTVLHLRIFKSIQASFAMHCIVVYGFDISSFLSSLVSPGGVCWRHHLSNVSTSLQAEVDVIKDLGHADA